MLLLSVIINLVKSETTGNCLSCTSLAVGPPLETNSHMHASHVTYTLQHHIYVALGTPSFAWVVMYLLRTLIGGTMCAAVEDTHFIYAHWSWSHWQTQSLQWISWLKTVYNTCYHSTNSTVTSKVHYFYTFLANWKCEWFLGGFHTSRHLITSCVCSVQ